MKKFAKVLVGLLAVSILSTSFVGCTTGSDDSNVTSPEVPGVGLTDGTTLETIVKEIEAQIGLQMPGMVDETMFNDMFYITSDIAEESYGVAAMTMTSADNVIAVKAKPGKVEEVVAALERRKEDVIKSFETYLPDQLEKAQTGTIVVKGDYVFLLILGDYEKGLENEITKAEEIINSFFK